MTQFAFVLTLNASAYVEAASLEEARRMLKEARLDGTLTCESIEVVDLEIVPGTPECFRAGEEEYDERAPLRRVRLI